MLFLIQVDILESNFDGLLSPTGATLRRHTTHELVELFVVRLPLGQLEQLFRAVSVVSIHHKLYKKLVIPFVFLENGVCPAEHLLHGVLGFLEQSWHRTGSVHQDDGARLWFTGFWLSFDNSFCGNSLNYLLLSHGHHSRAHWHYLAVLCVDYLVLFSEHWLDKCGLAALLCFALLFRFLAVLFHLRVLAAVLWE